MSDEEKKEYFGIKNLPIKRRYLILFGLAVLVILIGYFLYDVTGYQSTDDAYVETTTVSVSPKVAGQIVKVITFVGFEVSLLRQ